MPDLNVTRFAGVTLPTANQYVILFDSTRGFQSTPANSTTLVSTAGQFRGRYAGQRFEFTTGSTTQDVTLVRQVWDGTAWQTVSSGSETLTAGTLYPRSWLPPSPDFRAYILAGGTAPATLLFEATLTKGDRASGS